MKVAARPIAFAALLGLAIFAIALPCAAADRKPPAAEATYSYALQDVDIAMAASEVLGEGLNVAVTTDPRVQGRMSFVVQGVLTKKQLLAAFEAALAAHNVVVVRDGAGLKLQPRDGVQTAVPLQEGLGGESVGYQVRAVPLRFGSASEIAKALGAVSRESLVLFQSDELGLIVVAGTSDELAAAQKAIDIFDQDGLAEARIRYVPIVSADVMAVATDLERLLAQARARDIRIAPMRRLNGLFILARTPEALARTVELASRLDRPSGDLALKLEIYRPQGGSVDVLARHLSRILGISSAVENGAAIDDRDRATADAPDPISVEAPSAGSDARRRSVPQADAGAAKAASDSARITRIVADRETNTLLIYAPEAMRVHILSLLASLDQPPLQVYLDASIVEVTLNDDTSLGVDWKLIRGAGAMSVFSGASTSFPTLAPGTTVTYLRGGVKAAVTALSAQSKVVILSNPQLITRDNREAILKIGDLVPVITQSAQGTATANAVVLNSISYRDTGVIVRVTPRILSNRQIALELEQEVSSVRKTQTSGIDSPTFSQRQIRSQLVVPEGVVIALGGLISSSKTSTQSGPPFLSRVPIVKYAAGATKRAGDRTELVVLLEARIVDATSQFDVIWKRLAADMTDLSRTGLLRAR
ncbi:MAG: type II secretion system protein GspD [Caulobacterales bacterium]